MRMNMSSNISSLCAPLPPVRPPTHVLCDQLPVGFPDMQIRTRSVTTCHCTSVSCASRTSKEPFGPSTRSNSTKEDRRGQLPGKTCAKTSNLFRTATTNHQPQSNSTNQSQHFSLSLTHSLTHSLTLAPPSGKSRDHSPGL